MHSRGFPPTRRYTRKAHFRSLSGGRRMQDTPTIVIGILHATFLIPLCRSLKEKRSALKPCIERLRNRFNVSVAEVGDQDIWGRARIAVVSVSSDRTVVENILQQIESVLARDREMELTDVSSEVL
jgi:uncharacterized protein YlxP (DUF503 family)